MFDRRRRAHRYLEETEDASTATPDRATPSVARDVVLAALDPDSGRLVPLHSAAVPGALLLELTREGRLQVAASGKKTRVTVRNPAPLGDAELDEALLTVGSGAFGQRVTRLLAFLPESTQVLERLVTTGVVVEESDRKFGMVPVRRRHATPTAGRDELVARLRSALLGESQPDDRTALLVSVLVVSANLKHWVPKQDRKEADRRAREILERLGPDERTVLSAVQVAVLASSGDSTSL